MSARSEQQARQAGMSLVGMAVILTMVAIMAASMVGPMLRRIERGGIKSAKDSLRAVRDEILGYAWEHCDLPVELPGRHSGRMVKDIKYFVPKSLTRGRDLDRESESFSLVIGGDRVDGVAFVLVAPGRNQSFEVDTGYAPTPDKPLRLGVLDRSSESGSAFFDDVYMYVTLDSLKCGGVDLDHKRLSQGVARGVMPNAGNPAKGVVENGKLFLLVEEGRHNGAVAAWYAGSPGDDYCDGTGICPLGRGLRAFFTCRASGKVDGFTFALTGVRNARGDSLYKGADFWKQAVGGVGQSNGYGACNRDCVGDAGLLAPKTAVEFDLSSFWQTASTAENIVVGDPTRRAPGGSLLGGVRQTALERPPMFRRRGSRVRPAVLRQRVHLCLRRRRSRLRLPAHPLAAPIQRIRAVIRATAL